VARDARIDARLDVGLGCLAHRSPRDASRSRSPIRPMLEAPQVFGVTQAAVGWQGRHVADPDAFRHFLSERVRHRLWDSEEADRFEAELRVLATTEMATATLAELLTEEIEKQPWEVGEAMAECILEDEQRVVWPWNTERDKRTPRASLPGADLIGFACDDAGPILVLGEVKTSEDGSCPPNVMYGGSGMVHQIDELAKRRDIHGCVLRWLRARCTTPDLHEAYKVATSRYLRSGGREIALVGMLMRDTPPHENDLAARFRSLSRSVGSPTRLLLAAWYLPMPLAEWVTNCPKAA
jgi:hypothetical protein